MGDDPSDDPGGSDSTNPEDAGGVLGYPEIKGLDGRG